MTPRGPRETGSNPPVIENADERSSFHSEEFEPPDILKVLSDKQQRSEVDVTNEFGL